jgi:hypothetical protein
MLQKLRNLWTKTTAPTFEFTAPADDVKYFTHPAPASKYLPEWYKVCPRHLDQLLMAELPYDTNEYVPNKLPTNALTRMQAIHTLGTVKTCMPIRDMLTTGYIIPLWVDWIAEVNKEKQVLNFAWNYQAKHSWLTEHHKSQFPNSPFEKETVNDVVLKMNGPWRYKTPPGYSTLFMAPPLRDLKFNIIPAIVDTDQQHEVNFPFTYVGPDGDYEILKGEPLVLAIPFRREKYNHIVRADTAGEVAQEKIPFSTSVSGYYKKFRWNKKSYR